MSERGKTLLAGHSLVREGAPYDARGRPVRNGMWWSHTGAGRAKAPAAS